MFTPLQNIRNAKIISKPETSKQLSNNYQISKNQYLQTLSNIIAESTNGILCYVYGLGIAVGTELAPLQHKRASKHITKHL